MKLFLISKIYLYNTMTKTKQENPDEEKNEVKIEKEFIPDVRTSSKDSIRQEETYNLNEFCATLPNTGIDKYAKVRMEEKMKEWNINFEKKTFKEWEEIYNKVKNS